MDYMEGFFSDFNRLDVGRVAFGGLGTLLYGDYNERGGTNLNQSVALITDVLAFAAGYADVLLDGVNVYALPYVSRLMNVPVSSSGFFIQSDSIPFLPMVLHGYVPFSATPLNLGQDIHTHFLRAVEAGADLQFTLAVRNLERLKETQFPNFYSVGADAWQDRIIEFNRLMQETFAGLRDRTITDHRILGPGLRMTEFGGEVRIFVNYTNQDAEVYGVTVPANFFTVGG